MLKPSFSEKKIPLDLNALAEAFRLQDCILDASAIAILSTDTDGILTSFNACAEKLLGYSAEEVVRKSTPVQFFDITQLEARAGIQLQGFDKGTEPEFNFLVSRVKNTSKPDRQQWTLLRKDGTSFTASVVLAALRDEDQNISGFAAVIVEEDSGEKILDIDEETRRFFDNPVNLNAITDFDGKLKRISSSWTELLGWTEQELRSRSFLDFIHPDDRAATSEIFVSLTEGRKVLTFEDRVVSPNGSYHWLLWSAASDPDKRIIYATAIDITERKKSEENILDSKSSLETIAHTLQEQNRKLDEFAHIISHNLRAPVNNIQALINLLDENSPLNDYKLIFDKLKNVAKNLSETMNELMDTLKAKTHPDVELTEIRFKEILDKVVQSLEGELIVAQASVTFDFNDAGAIRYSKPYLESIFQNLLTNAIKYRSPERTLVVHFKSAVSNGVTELRVQDNGQGIDLKRFGDKLFGMHKTFHDHHEARGVGLFLIKTQIEAMGGKISVESEVDKGSTFIIKFDT
jgi:PAS domain S-box-containing protein